VNIMLLNKQENIYKLNVESIKIADIICGINLKKIWVKDLSILNYLGKLI
jgi:hypothetical protein